MNDDNTLSRSKMIEKLVAAPIAIGAFASLTANADAAASIDQKTAGYVTHPVQGRQCADCILYIDPKACKLVKGTISPHGYCKHFTAERG